MRLFTGEFNKLPLQSSCTCQGTHELEKVLHHGAKCSPRLHAVSAYATHVRPGAPLAHTQ